MSTKNDSLGDRMKEYEDVTRFKLSKKSYILCRIDGKAFHSYTKGLERPFDQGFIDDMNATAMYLCKKIQNAKFAYVQSDEISILLHEDGQDTQAWFDNNIQKMTSVAASMATSEFNRLRLLSLVKEIGALPGNWTQEYVDQLTSVKQAEFDSRFWTLPSAMEVYNYFLWRQQDATRNSISAAAQALYSDKELHGKSGADKQELMFQKGVNWNDYASGLKRGRFIERVTYINGKRGKVLPATDPGLLDQYHIFEDWNETMVGRFPDVTPDTVIRNRWEVVECPVFSQDKPFLFSRIKINYDGTVL